MEVLINAPVSDAAATLGANRVIAVDFETTGLDPLTDSIVLYAFKGETGDAYVYDAAQDVSPILSLLCDSTHIMAAHNAAFEYSFLTRIGWEVTQVFCTQVAEAVITSGLIVGDRRAGLSEVAEKYVGVTLSKELQTSFVGVDTNTFRATQAQYEYAAQDVLYLHDIMARQMARIEAENLLRVTRLEMAFLPCLAEMTLNGFKLNRRQHSEVLLRYSEVEATTRDEVVFQLDRLYQQHFQAEEIRRAERHSAITAEIAEVLSEAGISRLAKDSPADVRLRVTTLRKEAAKVKAKEAQALNLNSSEQVWQAFAQLGIELYKSEWNDASASYEDKKSTDANLIREYIKKHPNPVLSLYLSWAKAAKVVSTYGLSLAAQIHPADNRVHASYNQLVNSGRLSSNNPNQQNMPPDIRACFEPEAGNCLVVADAKNQEGRLAAALSGDDVLLSVFLEGKDWHSMTAAAAWPELYADWTQVPKESKERARAKNANFSSIYGGVAGTLLSRGYVDDIATGERLMAAIASGYPRLANWSRHVADDAVANGWVATISGRKRYFHRLGEKAQGNGRLARVYRKKRGDIRRAAMNHPVQGSGADIMKQAMVFLRQPMQEIGYRLVAMVHDEIVYEGSLTHSEAASTLVAAMMEKAASCFVTVLPIPGDCHVVDKWEK